MDHMKRFVKWWVLGQTFLGLVCGIPFGWFLTTLPAACRVGLYSARSGADLVAALRGCPEARGLLDILEYIM